MTSHRFWKDMFVSTQEGIPIIQFLLDDGLEVNAMNAYGRTMLSYAAECGNLQIAELLVQRGADANVANYDGSKPLHIAAKCGCKDIVKFFLNTGVSVDICDSEKRTPLHHVAEKCDIRSAHTDQEIVHILVDHNANINAVDIMGLTPLLLAVQTSHKHIVELFIKSGANLECCDENQWTVLHHACRNGWSGIVRTLIEGRFDINIHAETSKGYPPVIIAADFSDEDIVKLLVENGADVKCRVICGETLLHSVCKRGWLEMVKCLLSKGCDLNAKDKWGRTPLITAVDCSHLSVVKYLIECGADVKWCNEEGRTLLHYAKVLEMVKYLVSKGCDPNAKDYYWGEPLTIAARHKRPSVVEYLIKCGVDVKCFYNKDKEQTLLLYACEEGWLEVVKSLLSKVWVWGLKAKDKWGRTPLITAVDCSHSCIVEYLIECGVNFNDWDENGRTALHIACLKGSLEIVKALLSKGCDFNATDYWGKTPLAVAADYSHSSIVEYLFEFGEEDTVNRQTCLHFACSKEWLEVVKSLVSKGCDLNHKDKLGRTPLLIAAEFFCSSVAEYLIECGADMEGCDADGRTLLHFACRNGWFELVTSLTKQGFNVNAKTVNNDIPLYLAIQYQNEEIIKHLLIAGADCNTVNINGETPFTMFVQRSRCLEVMILFLRSGAYFQFHGYVRICKNNLLKEGILQNAQLCTVALINKFNNADLLEIYKIPSASRILPVIDELKIVSQGIVQDITECVKYEIQTKGFCNVLNVRPIVLRRLCVLTLMEHYNS